MTPARTASTAPAVAPRRRLPLALRRPAWLAGLAAVALFAAAAAFLGTWQWDRGEAADVRDDAVADHYDLPPVDPADALVDGAVPPDALWTPVRLTGRYDPTTVTIRNRPQDGRNGFLVTSPFVLERAVDGRDVVWVVRGWVPAGDDARPAAVPRPPSGPSEVVARIRLPEQPSGRTAPDGQSYRLAPADLAGVSGVAAGVPAAGRAVDGYAVLASGSPGGDALVEIPRPPRDPGPHLAYALQWWLFALAGFGIWLAFYRRAAREDAEAAGITADAGDAGAAGGARPGAPPPEDAWTYRPGG